MKKIIAGIFIGLVVLGTSCKKYFDINQNPNNAVTASPELILPQALAYTANVINGYNSYGSQTGLYAANAGGYGGFGESITYNYTTSFTGNWASSYDNLEDYQTILNKTEGNQIYANYNAVARIMKAYNFQLLVDAFNDVPYADALKGADVLSPSYTDAKVIYKDLADELDKAIDTINTASALPGITPLGGTDIVFNGDMTKWKKFATTLKLRIILRAGGKVTFSNTNFDEGFLGADAMINPGYVKDGGKQNPAWNSWAFGNTGTSGNKAWMPSQFIFGFYDGHTLNDSARGKAIYYQWPDSPSQVDVTGTNRLGIESNSLTSAPNGNFWYSDPARFAGDLNHEGVLKGPNAPYPLLLLSESKFLQAEAVVRGIITGNSADLFNSGILAAYTYTYRLASFLVKPGVDPGALVTAYIAKNPSSYLVNYTLANTDEKKIEAIITQKFIALNFIHGHEAWNEYRRTHYPRVMAGGNGYETFASIVSESPRPDKLPTRIMYPSSEGSYNSENVPGGISPFTSLIFWAQ